ASLPVPDARTTRPVRRTGSTLDTVIWIWTISTVCSAVATKLSTGLWGPLRTDSPPGTPLETMVTVAPSRGNVPVGRSVWPDVIPRADTWVAAASRAARVAPMGAVPLSEQVRSTSRDCPAGTIKEKPENVTDPLSTTNEAGAP